MILAMSGPGMKATYTFTDGNIEEGKTYYRLQDIDTPYRSVLRFKDIIFLEEVYMVPKIDSSE